MRIQGPPEFSLWGAWSSCSKTCGDGEKNRNRNCNNHCEGVSPEDKSETGTCNDGNCKLFIEDNLTFTT